MLPSGTRVRTRADGTLAETPLAHVLVYIRNKKLTGTLELYGAGTDPRNARFDFWRGSVVTAQTTPVVARFGSVVYELSWIDSKTLDEALSTSNREKLPVADILLASKAITKAQRDEALVEQVRRRVHYTFTFPPDAQFTFQERNPATREPPLIVDVLAPIWRGILDFPPEIQIAEVLSRLGESKLVMVSEAALERAGLGEKELLLCEALTRTPMTLRELHERFVPYGARVDQLAYLLIIAKCAEVEHALEQATTRRESAPTLPEIETTPAPQAPAAPPVAAAPPMASGRRRSFELSCMKIPAAAAAHYLPSLESRPALIVSPEDLGSEGIRIRASTLAFETTHEALGLYPGASAEAARAAYVRLSRLWHPDHLPLGLQAVEGDAALIFRHINDAYRQITEAAELLATAGARKADTADVG